MARKERFAFIEFLMEAVCVTALLAMVALIAVQSTTAVSSLSDQRAARHLAAMKKDLERVAERQVMHFLDSSEFAANSEDLRFVSSEGVGIRLTTSAGGWSATAYHEQLGEQHGCAVFYGSVAPPSAPVTPGTPGEVSCTE